MSVTIQTQLSSSSTSIKTYSAEDAAIRAESLKKNEASTTGPDLSIGLALTHRDFNAHSLKDIVEINDPEAAKLIEEQEEMLRELREKAEFDRAAKKRNAIQAAQKKVEEIKEKIRQLQMLRLIDPEAAAREAARLAKELKQVVKDVAAAGGNSGSIAGIAEASAGGGQANAAQPAAAQPNAASTDPSGTVAGLATATAQVSAESIPTESAPETGAAPVAQDETATVSTGQAANTADEIAEAGEPESKTPGSPNQADKSAQDEDKNKEAFNEKLREKARENLKSAGLLGADAQSLAELKEAIREVIQALRDLIEGAEDDDKKSDPQDKKKTAEAKADLKETEKLMNSLSMPSSIQISA